MSQAEPVLAETTTEQSAPDTAQPQAETKAEEKPTDGVSEYRTFAILGYILPFLFFLPLLDDKTKNVRYVRFHANQQLVFLIVVIAVGILEDFLPLHLGYYFSHLAGIVLIAYAIIGALNGYKNEMKELPFIGQFRLLK